MDTLIPESYRQYGAYVNSFRAFPLVDDGLKPVERRILLTTFMVAKDKFVKSARITGNCMAKFHPHSDAYGTLVQLVRQGLIDGQGNFGNSLGVDPSPPAASRYTECRLSTFTYNIAFKLIRHVPWVESELDDEPEYIPTMYPMCLLGNEYTQGIGFGYRTYIPCYEIGDLKTRLLWLLTKKGAEPIIKPKSDCKITATNTDLKNLLTTGKGKINVEGVTRVNNINNKLTVKSWPPGRRFEALLNRPSIRKFLENQDIGYIDSSSGANGTSIVFSVLKQRNRDKIFAEFLKQIKEAVKGSISFESVMVDLKQNVSVVSIDDMLLKTYERFKDANTNMLNHELDKNKRLIDEYNYLSLIKTPLTVILGGTTLNFEEKVKFISTQSKISEKIVRDLLSKYHIRKLLTFDTDTKDLEEKNKQVLLLLQDVNSYVVNQY